MVPISASPEEKQVLYSVHAPVLMSALNNSNLGSSIACSVVSDALSVVRKLPRRNNGTNTIAVRSSSIPTQPATILLPLWLNRDYISGQAQNGANDSFSNPTYVFCSDDLMTQLNSVESYALSNLYGAFFNKIFARAKRQKIVSGPMNYKLLTPPWMKSTVYFVYGPTQTKPYPLQARNYRERIFCAGQVRSHFFARLSLHV